MAIRTRALAGPAAAPVVAAGLVVAGAALVHAGHDQGRLLVLLAAVVGPLVLSVRTPLIAWSTYWLAAVLAPLVPDERRVDVALTAVGAVLLVNAVLRRPRQLAVSLAGLQLAAVWVWAVPVWRTGVVASAGIVLVAVAADAIAARRGATRELAVQTDRTRVESERRAVLEERARIAREMHDIVAHHLSLIAVQTSTAPYRLPDASEPVLAEFESLNSSARAALADTRTLLDTLRDTSEAERAPQPTLADVPALVETARRAGMSVRLTRTGAAAVRPTVAVSAYRIVQEALSNAARHAPGAEVEVSLDSGPDCLRVRVGNGDGTAAPVVAEVDDHGDHGGHGLAGMRERVTAHAGTLHAGPRSGGGFEVRAELPIDRS